MNHQDVTVSNMVWCPALIMLHQVGMTPEREPTICFCDPAQVEMIRLGLMKVTSVDEETHKWVEATIIHMKNSGHTLSVTEAPEVIARLRDEAFGHKTTRPSLAAVPEE